MYKTLHNTYILILPWSLNLLQFFFSYFGKKLTTLLMTVILSYSLIIIRLILIPRVKIYMVVEPTTLHSNRGGGATLRSGWSQDHPNLNFFFYIYNNLKKFICLPFKKNLRTPSVFFFFFFYADKIKFCSIICFTFSRWMIAWLYTLKKM